MKKYLLYVLSFIGGAAIFGAIGILFGYSIATSNEPAVFIRNLSDTNIPQITIETDVGESYDFGPLSPNASRRVNISGREKLAWIVLMTQTGQKQESPKLYVSSEGVLFGIVTDSGVTVDYVP